MIITEHREDPTIVRHFGRQRDLLTEPAEVSDLGARIVAGFLADMLAAQYERSRRLVPEDRSYLVGLSEAEFRLRAMAHGEDE